MYEVSDLSAGEAEAYLVERGLGPRVAADAVGLVAGGRLILLSTVAKLLLAGKSVSAILADFNRHTLGDLEKIGVHLGSGSLKNQSPHQWDFFDTLGRDGSVSVELAARLLGADLIGRLLAKNVISARANATFVVHSRHVATLLKSLGFGKPKPG